MSALRYLRFAKRAVRRSGPPVHLTLFVTGTCNARCRHCFHWREVAAGVAGPSLENVRLLGASVARMGPLLWLSFGGGEPFLRADLAELGAAFRAARPRHLAIPTNGLQPARTVELTRALARALPDTFLSIGVSFDGPPDVHDELRQVPGGHAKSMECVRALKELGRELGRERLGVGVIVTVTRSNQHVLADHLEELVRELAPDNVTINLARGTALDETQLEVDIDRYGSVCARKERLMREGLLPYFAFPMARLAVARDRETTRRVAGLASGRPTPHLACSAGKLSATIFEDGSVHPCEILGEPLGELREHDWDLERLWRSARADELRERIRATRCSCTFECVQADNVLFSPRAWPRLALATLRANGSRAGAS